MSNHRCVCGCCLMATFCFSCSRRGKDSMLDIEDWGEYNLILNYVIRAASATCATSAGWSTTNIPWNCDVTAGRTELHFSVCRCL